ncbi:MAG: EVE domain-containing protein [Nitrospirae bacterium]|nr:EVE domain-containing protein [Nitrospirota bacterium]
MISLKRILDLAGRLDDSPGENTPRERFRSYLRSNVMEVGQLRDYIEECLGETGEQPSRALQDMVVRLGELLGFDVAYGRYNGGRGEVGFDGLWKSPGGFSLVIEVKTSETYAIKTSALVGYVDELISQGVIPGWDHALGLYVVGRPDPQVRQLENAIIAEKRTHQLRVASVESLLSLAEMVDEQEATHEDVLAILRPSTPDVDPVVDLLARLMARREPDTLPKPALAPSTEKVVTADEPTCWLAPVGSNGSKATEIIRSLVGVGRVFALGDRSPARRQMKENDQICFYACGVGAVAHARIASRPEKGLHAEVPIPEKYPWGIRLGDVHLYVEQPKVLNAKVRAELDAFEGRNPEGSWGWFLKMTRRISPKDFEILTSRG